MVGGGLPNNPFGWGCAGSLAGLIGLGLIQGAGIATGNQPGLLFLMLLVGFAVGFAIAAKVQWGGSAASAPTGAIVGDNVTGQETLTTTDTPTAASESSGSGSNQPPNRAIVDTLTTFGWAGGAVLGFVAVLALAWYGIVGSDIWLLIGPLAGASLGIGIASLVIRRLRSGGTPTNLSL